MKIGFVGLGIMGHPMALNLIKGGHELFVYGKRRLPVDVREAGGVRLTGRRQESRQGAIDVLRRARFLRAWAVLVGGNQPRAHGFEDVGFGGGE